LCHHNADPDAICSAYAFNGLLGHLRPELKTQISVPSGPSKLSKKISKLLPIVLTKNPHIEESDLIFLLDTNTIQQLDDWSNRIVPGTPLVVIDHHATHPKTEQIATISITEETALSTCAVIYHLFQQASIQPNQLEARAMFLGIAYDTRHFILANSETLKIIADLTDCGVDAQEALSILSLPMDFSERIARLKAANRIKILRIKDWLIVYANIGAYQASVARSLIALGADVAIVAGKKEDKIQVSFRASQQFYKSTKFHMGRNLATPLGEFINGMGGGHSVSAGTNGVGDINSCFNFCKKILKKKLI
jgi:nanoRNase/pAp phosphatase (c-di-AMP/oligoRNAs hydrolase)